MNRRLIQQSDYIIICTRLQEAIQFPIYYFSNHKQNRKKLTSIVILPVDFSTNRLPGCSIQVQHRN